MEQHATQPPANGGAGSPTGLRRLLNALERLGNRLPDPAILFLVGLLITLALSKLLANVDFQELHPSTGEPLRIIDQLNARALAKFFTTMVEEFVRFPPLGVVLVCLLGVGVAEHSGFINACLRGLLSITPKALLTPMVIFVGLLSHAAADAGYVLVIPLGGVIFYAAGRHPLAGIAAAFAGVAGGFSACPVPCSLDPLLSGLTQAGAALVEPAYKVNPMCNFAFTASSTVLIILAGWLLTDRVIEPHVRHMTIDGDPAEMPRMDDLGPADRRGVWIALLTMLVAVGVLVAWAWPADSALRDSEGKLASRDAPLMKAIVPWIFILFLVPGVVFGYVSGRFKSHRDVIAGMSRTMATMGYYLVLVFFAALFLAAFRDSQMGALVALKGAGWLKSLGAGQSTTIVGIILLSTLVNLLIGSASAKWGLLAPIFVPMLMLLKTSDQPGISPEFTQAAYRVGDSCTNIITPMMPYFPLVVVFCQRYVRSTGIGTLVSMMLPYSVTFLVIWTSYLLIYWWLGLPLGADAPYTYPAGDGVTSAVESP